MALGNLSQALTLAQQWTWEEYRGYVFGGMGYASDDYGFDCSGFVGRALHDSGFSYPATHVGTLFMDSALLSAGFMKLPYSNNFVPEHGDIFVMNHGSNGHTFFYAENVTGYTDPGARSNNTGLLARAKIEASSSRTSGYSYADGDPGTIPGDVNNPNTTVDYPRNGTGAHWEVWTHAYSVLVNRNTYPNDSDTWVYRLPTNDKSIGVLGAMLTLIPHKRNKRRF